MNVLLHAACIREFFLSLTISLGLIILKNYAVSDIMLFLCHGFPSLVNYVWTYDTCFDVGFFLICSILQTSK